MIVSPRTPTDAANLGETALRASAVETVWREMRLRRAGLEATVADMMRAMRRDLGRRCVRKLGNYNKTGRVAC